METYLIKALQLILSLSILVIIHEFGHFIFARIFKIRVEKFYLFFDPWFSLFKFKPKGGDTEYGIGWLPLGGYVKIAGMIDESMDKAQMALPPKPDEFRSKPAWQRLLVMAAGVIFNFILAIFIYSMVLFTWGKTYIPLKNTAPYGLEFSAPAQKLGFQNGDILLRTDRGDLESLGMHSVVELLRAKKATVLRHGKEVDILLPQDSLFMGLKNAHMKEPICTLYLPNVVDSVLPKSPAQLAGLHKGDSIVSVDGVATPAAMKFAQELDGKSDKLVSLAFYRAGALQTVKLKMNKDGIFGFTRKAPQFKEAVIHYTFLQSVPAGIHLGLQTLSDYVSQIRYAVKAPRAIGGFGALGSMFPPLWDWFSFWMTTAFLSVVLAFMNILPIPALDGGHIMFLFYEIITRRKPSDKFLEYATTVGIVLLIALLVFANGNDLVRLIFK